MQVYSTGIVANGIIAAVSAWLELQTINLSQIALDMLKPKIRRVVFFNGKKNHLNSFFLLSLSAFESADKIVVLICHCRNKKNPTMKLRKKIDFFKTLTKPMDTARSL